MDDRQTVRKVLRGDKEAYRGLVERYEKGLFHHVCAMVHDPDLAEDICQDAFVKAYRSLRQYDPKFAFSTWLYRIAHNLTVSAVRKQRPTLPLDELPEIPTRQNLAAEQERRDDNETLRRAVAELPLNYQTAISLYYWQDMAYEDIAKVMEVPEGTIKTWLHRAKQALKESLDGQI